jgi:hypothetical protein
MRWPRWYLKRGDVIGVLLVLLVLGLVAFRFYLFPKSAEPDAGTGFGPDWDCTPVPNGQPTCIKRVPPRK